jgi:hypothetical protein
MIRLRRCNLWMAAWILAAALLPVASATADGLTPQRFETLRPAISPHRADEGVRLEFAAFGRDYRLELAANPRLAAAAKGSTARFFAGSIEGIPGSWARISIQDGVPRGMLWDGRELFVVEEPPAADEKNIGSTVMFRLADSVLEEGVSLEGDTVKAPRDAAAAYRALVDELGALQAQVGIATRRLEVSVLGDASYVSRYGSEAQARDAILTRLNNVDGIFTSQVGVQLHVASVNLADDLSAGLSATSNSSALLDELGSLRQRTPALNSTGETHLFTGRAFDGNTAGIAYVDGLCSPRYAASLAMAHSSAALDTLITAHEIGHVFGAPHDGAEQCAATPQGQYIMTPTVNTAITTFSQCSLDQMRPVIASSRCLATLAAADLGLPASLGSQTATAGADFAWQVSISNLGGRAASGARATLQVTPALTISSASTAGGSCVIQTGLVTCDLPVIEAAASQAIQLTLRNASSGTFELDAQVVLVDDSNAANNSSEGTLTVSAAASAPTPPPTGGGGGGGGGALDLVTLLLMLAACLAAGLLESGGGTTRRRA